MPDGPRLVSQRSDQDIARELAKSKVSDALVKLAANLLRIVRGAGKPYELLPQMSAYITAARGYFDAHGRWPDSDLMHPLLSTPSLDDKLRWKMGRPGYTVTEADFERWSTDGTFDRDYAIQKICDGALQYMASRMLDQLTQATSGKRELLDGVRDLEHAREKQRQSFGPVRAEKRRAMSRKPAPTTRAARPILRKSDGTPFIPRGRKPKD